MQEVPVPGEPPSPSHLIVVALGEEQGTELPVERCLVGLLPVLGQLVHVGLGQLERLLSQVVLAVPVANVQQPWGMQRELLRELQEPSHAAAPGSRGGHTHGWSSASPAELPCSAWGHSHTHLGTGQGFFLLEMLQDFTYRCTFALNHSGVLPLCVVFHKIHSSQY